MALPVIPVAKNKKKKPSLPLTLGTAGLLIGGGIAGYWFLTQGKPLSRDLPVGVSIIPRDAVMTVSLSTDERQWNKLREFGTKKTQKELDKNLVQLRDRFLSSNGYDYQKDISPWIGNELTIAVLAPKGSKKAPKPVAETSKTTANGQSLLLVLPIKNQLKAQEILAQPKTPGKGKWNQRTYQGIEIKEKTGNDGEKFAVAAIDERFLVIADRPKAMERGIDAYTENNSLEKTAGFTQNFPKISTYNPFARFYINVPLSAKIAASSPKRQLPAQVLTQLKNNQGLAGSITLESEGINFKGVSWLNPNGRRELKGKNNAGKMEKRLPADTILMVSGGNLQRSWFNYVSTSKANPLSPVKPEELKKGFKSLTKLDLERDVLSWMKGEFSLSVIPTQAKEDTLNQDFRAAFVFMVQASDRSKAEAAFKKLDATVNSELQFQVERGKVRNQAVVNWLGPAGTAVATHGWLNGDTAFLSLGAPLTEKFIPKPSNSLTGKPSWRKAVPSQLNPHNGKFYLDLEQAAKNFPVGSLLPSQSIWLEAIRSLGVTTALSDRHSTRYDIFISVKKGDKPAPLPVPTINPEASESLKDSKK
ncbi:MAG: DUF3352 domain-containing protein [Cyanobacteria bacterium J06639_18]